MKLLHATHGSRPLPKGFAPHILAVLLPAALLAGQGRAEDSRPPTAPLTRVSQRWSNPAVATVGLPALLGESTVRFAAEEAIYEGSQPSVKPVVKSSSFIPDTVDTWAFFQRDHDRLNYDLPGGDELVFVGKNTRNDVGIYRASANRISRTWVKGLSAIPGGSGSFQRLRYPQSSGDWLVFVGYGANGQKGVYRVQKQTLERVADASTLVPGGDHHFNDFTYARILADGSVVFTGYSESGSGLYLAKAGQPIQSLVDRRTLEPRSKRPYSGALLVGLEDSWVYFTSFGGSVSIGRMRIDGSSLETLVDEETPLGSQTGKLGAVNYASVKQGRILFEAATHGTVFDLYLWEEGSVRPLVQHGDRLEDGTVIGVRCGLEGLSPTHFTCLVDVDPGENSPMQRAVYLGRLATGSAAPTSLGSAPASKTTSPGSAQFKLGSGPIPVLAREPGKSSEEPQPARPEAPSPK